jgi:hypothetical protein
MKKLFLVLALVALTTGGFSMIETLSLEQLAAKSDLIVFANVLGVKNTGQLPEGVGVVANLIEITEVLKGDLSKGEKVKIKTFAGVEDSAAFAEGKKYLLFLQKQDGFYVITNSIQGSWGIAEDGSFTGMGTGKNLADVKKAISAKPLKFQPKVPDLQL